jgi:hypothetical protein
MPDPDPQHPERRRSIRQTAKRLLHCLVCVAGASPATAAVLLDLSHSGAGLVVARPLPAGVDVVVRIARAGEARPSVDLPARVVHAAELGLGRCLLGVELATPLGTAELRAIQARMG